MKTPTADTNAAQVSLASIDPDVAKPDVVDVVVVGGGIAGVCTAFFLAQKGHSVCVCEKGHIAGEQSSRNWGWTRQMGREPVEMPLSIESLKLWRGFKSEYRIETGYRETGITYLARTDKEKEEAEIWAETGKSFQLPQQILTDKQIESFLPGIASGFCYALHTKTDGRAEPGVAVPAIARAARRLGVTILTNCAVRGLETAGGRISAAITERGPIRCTSIVVAGGAWSRLFLGNIGVDFPQLKILGTAARVDNIAGVPDMPVGGVDFAFRRRLDGGLTIAQRNINIAPIVPDSFRLLPEFLPTIIKSWQELRLRVGRQFLTEFAMPRRWSLDEHSPFERIRVLDPAPHQPFNQKALKTLRRAFPAFSAARITHNWAGLIDATPDGIPVIDEIEGWRGLYLASGFSGHGFGIGPGAGKLMAQIVAGETPVVDPVPFRLSRFGTNKSAERFTATRVAGKV